MEFQWNSLRFTSFHFVSLHLLQHDEHAQDEEPAAEAAQNCGKRRQGRHPTHQQSEGLENILEKRLKAQLNELNQRTFLI